MTLGEKIKKARTESGMTQTELAEPHITRNMLSQIENNTAIPSIATIKHISAKLNIPAGYFLTDKNDDFIYKKMYVISDIKEMFRLKQYEHCIDLCKALNGSDDETEYILSNSYFALAYENFILGKMKTAENLFSASLKHAKNTVYISNKVLQYSAIFLNFIKAFSNKLIKPPESVINHTPYTETMIYLNAVTAFAGGETSDIKFNDTYKRHIEAKKLLFKKDYAGAETILSELLENELLLLEKYMIIADMETCYVQTGDFKNAYKFSTMKNELYTQMFYSPS